jgi:hypothetical protein
MPIYLVYWTWIVLITLSLGLISVWAARRAEGSAFERLCQCLMMAGMVLVGATSVVALRLHSPSWIGCGATLSLMVVGATYEFRRPTTTSL